MESGCATRVRKRDLFWQLRHPGYTDRMARCKRTSRVRSGIGTSVVHCGRDPFTLDDGPWKRGFPLTRSGTCATRGARGIPPRAEMQCQAPIQGERREGPAPLLGISPGYRAMAYPAWRSRTTRPFTRRNGRRIPDLNGQLTIRQWGLARGGVKPQDIPAQAGVVRSYARRLTIRHELRRIGRRNAEYGHLPRYGRQRG